MNMKEDYHVFKGLKRGTHPIKQDGNFLWDAYNVRFIDLEDSSALAITNTRKPKDTNISLKGYYVGHCIVGDYLVVFTYQYDTTNKDHISRMYRISKSSNTYSVLLLFKDVSKTDAVWSTDNKIEARSYIESSIVQKVYWVDGVHQARVFNVVLPEYKGITINNYLDNKEDPEEETLWYALGINKDYFNFVPCLKLEEEVEVSTDDTAGEFASGVIQYAFSYYRKYGQQSRIFYTTPLNHIVSNSKGGAANENVVTSFRINVRNIDRSFDYLRVYSIHRTSLNGDPIVKVVADIPILSSQVTIVDSGNTGYTITPSQLLYIGGDSLIANTLAIKEDSLFLGNIKLLEGENFIEAKTLLKGYVDSSVVSVISPTTIFTTSYEKDSDYYYNDHNIHGIFKYGEIYRCGVQLQDSKGKWTEPIFLKDMILADSFPQTVVNSYSPVSKEITFLRRQINTLYSLGYRAMRACVVFPDYNDRQVICQGILCPTVYSMGKRADSTMFSQSSWFFRMPSIPNVRYNDKDALIEYGANIAYSHNHPLRESDNRGAEVQSQSFDYAFNPEAEHNNKSNDGYSLENTPNPEAHQNLFFVDENIVTFHSPDVEFDSALQQENLYSSSVKLRIIGRADLKASYGDINITTSTPAISVANEHFNHIPIKSPFSKKINIGGTSTPTISTGGLVSGLFYGDALIKSSYDPSVVYANEWYFMIYPWQQQGSLNNDFNGSKTKVKSSVLATKIISNLKTFESFPIYNSNEQNSVPTTISYDISAPKVFNSNEVNIVKVWVEYLQKEVLYFGNVDTIISQTYKTAKFGGDSFTSSVQRASSLSAMQGELSNYTSSNSPIRMKYKSSPHLVFSLSSDISSGSFSLPLLPRHSNTSVFDNLNNKDFIIPLWFNNEDPIKEEYPSLALYVYPDPNDASEEYVTISSIMDSQYICDETSRYLGQYLFIDRIKVLYKSTKKGWILQKSNAITSEYLRANKSVSRKLQGKMLYKGYTFDSEAYSKDTYYKVSEVGKVGAYYRYSLTEMSSIPSTPTLSKGKYTQATFNVGDNYSTNPYLLIGELVRTEEYNYNRFGGTTEEAIRGNVWYPAGDPIPLLYTNSSETSSLVYPYRVVYKYGDTWYGRYDCLKTYPFTKEDENQIVEIGSFMLESRINPQGRYDKNKGNLSNLYTTPQNFNLYNPVYSQKDNFFEYRVLDEDYYKQSVYTTSVTWSLTKSNNSIIDTWCNINFVNNIKLSEQGGNLNKLSVWNEYIICLQDKAISRLNYNLKEQISTESGIPIEIGNSGKVSGFTNYSNIIGCTNKWSVVETPVGIFFVDPNTESLYKFNGELSSVSDATGMTWWIKQYSDHTSNSGTPLRAFYDSSLDEVYYSLEDEPSLLYSNKLGNFMSFVDVYSALALFNFQNNTMCISDFGDNLSKVSIFNEGDYVNDWYISFISNQYPTQTKIFDNLEYRGDSYSISSTGLLSNSPTWNDPCFNYIKVDNEYQSSGEVNIETKKKFRVWRALLPRNASTISNSDGTTTTVYRERIRNPWAKITLGHKPVISELQRKDIIHDISVKYML